MVVAMVIALVVMSLYICYQAVMLDRYRKEIEELLPPF
jgi:uncharacterized membrane protein (DUF485 family)